MSEKRRGLGRGLGALIPSSSSGARPADVFFGESGSDVSRETAATAADSKDAAATAASVAGAAEAAGEGLQARSEATGAVTATGAASAGADAAQAPATPSAEGTTVETSDPLTEDGLLPVPGAEFREIEPSRIHPNSQQPRTVFDEDDLAELVGSIREIGVLQPIVVRPSRERPGDFELIMGERRWRASQEAGLERVPAIIRETDDGDLLRDALLENLHRSALNPLEEAAAYRQLLDDFGCTQEELATRISRSRPQISNTLRLLKLPPLVQRRVAAGVLSAGHARALLRLEDPAAMERLAQRIVAEGLSVRATEEIVALGGVAPEEEPKPRAPRPGQRIEAVDDLAGRLSDRFETRVKIALGKRKGRVTVEFASVEDLNRILAVMAPQERGLLT